MPGKKKDNNNDKTNNSDDSIITSGGQGVSQTPPTYMTDEKELLDTQDQSHAGKRPIHVRVAVRQGETVDQMLRRFNFAVTKSDLIQRLRDLQFYEKPSKRRQREEKLRLSQKRIYEE